MCVNGLVKPSAIISAVGGHVSQLYSLCSHFITDIVVLNIDVLGPGVEDRVMCQRK